MPNHIRDDLISTIATQLEGITVAAGYTRTVSRVYQTPPNGTNTPSPAVIITQGSENVEEFVGPVFERHCNVNITFVDNYAGNNSDGEALEFLGDIQRSMGGIYSFSYTAPRYTSGTATQNAMLTEEGSSLNYSDPMRGKIYGTASYTLTYRTSAFDPRKLP
jgi:hypothetical protein